MRDADEDGASSIVKAQAILERLRKRDLYKFVDEFIVPCNELDSNSYASLSNLQCSGSLSICSQEKSIQSHGPLYARYLVTCGQRHAELNGIVCVCSQEQTTMWSIPDVIQCMSAWICPEKLF
jgi:hypothetical protein